VAIYGQVTKEGSNLFLSHVGGMPLFVKQNEPPNPVEISFLSADRVTFDAEMPADAIKQARRGTTGGEGTGHGELA
jgi:hypothetical protein